MSAPMLQRANFDKALQKLKDFSDQMPEHKSFSEIPVDGTFWGFTDHQVTGKEMNIFMGELNDRLVGINKSFHGVIKEFREVYDVFDMMDREYVAGILRTFKEVDQVSKEAKTLSEENTNTINRLKKMAETLIAFKQVCESEHYKITQHTIVLEKLELQIQTLEDVQRQFTDQYREIRDFADFLRKKHIVTSIEELDSKTQRLEGDLISLQIQSERDQHIIADRVEYLLSTKEKTEQNIIKLNSQCNNLEGENKALQQQISSLLARQEAERKSYKQGLIIAYTLSGLAILLTCIFAIYGG